MNPANTENLTALPFGKKGEMGGDQLIKSDLTKQ